ncbi:hypothetical protein M9434_007197 [Picochlorum sp. BPE23]|nr:hypothetical protein M9434_007197 [Picochlorum sp. BPE23]
MLNLKEDQEKFHTEVGTFVNKVPLNHFGRKNIGYLYAILNGANQIFDFDDDNFLKTGNSLSTAASSIMEMHVKQECLVGNPYPLMGAPFAGNVPAWPRGYPLEKIKSNCSEYVQRFKRDKSILSVFQFLADVDPDVDGIFRLTRDIPFSFNSNSKDVIAVSPGLFVPFNAQATVFKYSSFWSLFLPTTVHGRVSDIWRSYIGQRVLWEFGSQIAFLPPGVDQIRNFHYPLADMNAEKDLYEKAMSLIELLADWVPSATSVAGMLEDLYIVLYEHDVIEIQDVSLLQEWLLAFAKESAFKGTREKAALLRCAHVRQKFPRSSGKSILFLSCKFRVPKLDFWPI